MYMWSLSNGAYLSAEVGKSHLYKTPVIVITHILSSAQASHTHVVMVLTSRAIWSKADISNGHCGLSD